MSLISRAALGAPTIKINTIFYRIFTLTLLLGACKAVEVNQSSILDFSEDGQIWGYGPVTLKPLNVSGRIAIERTSVQSLDSSSFRVFTVESGQPLPRNRNEPLYADWHPEHSFMTVYSHHFALSQRASHRNVFDLHAILKRPGPSKDGEDRVYLGYAVFHQGSRIAWLQPTDELSISRFAQGRATDFNRWVLHFPPLDTINSIISSSEGRFSFMSNEIESSNETNAKLCEDLFYALARTSDGRINHSCTIKAAPSPSPTSDLLTCSVDVSLAALNQAGEENCVVTGYFVHDGKSVAADEFIKLSL